MAKFSKTSNSKSRNKINLLTLLFVLFSAGLLQAGGPWPQAKGKGYFKLSEWWLRYNKHYTGSGLTDPNITTGVYNTFFYGEYGFTNRLTGIVNANLFSRNLMNNQLSSTTNEVLISGEALNAFGDIDLGVKFGLTKPGAKIPVAASLMLGIPSGKSSGGTFGNLQTGDGEFNQLIQIDAGTGFKLGPNIPAYASAYVGFNNRTAEFSEEFRFGIEAGLAFFNEKLWFTGRLSGVESFKNGATAETETSTGIFANNTEYTSFSVEANYYVSKKFGISAGMATAFRGEIIAAAPSYSVGIFYDMSKG